MVSKEEFQGWILDYACYHRIFPIIHAISLRHAGSLDNLPVSHLRLACATIHFIIESEQLSQFKEAIKLVQQVNQSIPPLVVCQKTYQRLLTGLQIKALFQQLEEDTDKALVMLNTYFPRSTPKSTEQNQGQSLPKFNQNHKNFRCFFFSLVSNENQLRDYLKEDYNAEFGLKFMQSIKKLCGRFLQQIESQLLPPMIEKVLACPECEKFSRISPATELLLDFVHEKKLSSQKDTSQQNYQQKGQRTILVFTEQELFEMLTVSYPLYTQDWLARDHGLNLSSQDLFDSFDSQETLPQPDSQMNSLHVTISKSQESASDSLAPLAESQDLQKQKSAHQGSSENNFQDCIQQTLQPHHQQESVHSSLASEQELPEAQLAMNVEIAEQQSAEVQGEVRQSALAPGEKPSQQCERIEDVMDDAQAQAKTLNQPQVIEDEVQSSQREPEMEYQPEEMIQDVQPSQMQLEALPPSQMLPQDEVPLQSRPERVEEILLPQSEILERSLSQLPQDQQLQIRSSQTLLQITDFVLPNDSAVHISFPLTQSADLPPNITSTPIHQPCEPSTSIDQQEKDNDSQRQATVIPIVPNPSSPTTVTQPKYIQPWPGYVPRKPSHKLCRSNSFKSCDIDDKGHQDAEMVVARKRPGPSAVTLKKNSPKHSLVAEENSDLSCDKGSDTLPSSGATLSSLHLSTDLSSISSGSCDIVTPSDSNSAEVFFMGTPEETIDFHYDFINRHLLQGVKACLIKLYRNQQLDVMDGEQVYRIYT